MGEYDNEPTKGKKSEKPRAKPSHLSDVDAGIILQEASALEGKINVLEAGPTKRFLLLHIQRITTKMNERLEKRGGKSLIMEAEKEGGEE